MPHNTTKPIVLICGSRSITKLNIGRYIRPSSVGAVISGGATGVDTLAEQWAKANNIETIIYKPNYKVFGKRAPLERDKDMVDACDVVICFWDGQSRGSKFTFEYAKSIGRKVIIHLIEELD